jgi:hypothetical protein
VASAGRGDMSWQTRATAIYLHVAATSKKSNPHTGNSSPTSPHNSDARYRSTDWLPATMPLTRSPPSGRTRARALETHLRASVRWTCLAICQVV